MELIRRKQAGRLVVVPSTPVWRDGDQLVFDRKFYDGMLQYLEFWGGPVRCIAASSEGPRPAFGLVAMKPGEMPFEPVVVGSTREINPSHLAPGDVVLASGDAVNQLHLAALCQKLDIPCVYSIEYVPETRYQIAELSTKNPVVRARRKFYVWNTERARRRAFRAAAGLQCNGTPAFEEYATEQNRLLYFDTRVHTKDVIGESALETRLRELEQGKPLRLAFSGRLIAMKGADHLIGVAQAVRNLGCPFELTIYGTGELEQTLRSEAGRYGLSDVVRLPGAVDFYGQLLPDMREKVDLFVCLHRQSDPSCTYLETLSCGVPIVGYDNRAFSGLAERAEIGWLVKMNDVQGVASVIARLSADRAELARKSAAARTFAKAHDFEATFGTRIEHLRATATGAPELATRGH